MKYVRIYDEESSTNWSSDPMVNELFLRNVRNYLNDQLRSRGHVFLNNVYDELGMTRTTKGQLVGWLYVDQDSAIDFGDGTADEKGAIVLEFNTHGDIHEKIEDMPATTQASSERTE